MKNVFISRLRYEKTLSIVLFAQVSILLLYLNLNIVSVGEAGVALPILAAYVAISGIVFLCMFLQNRLSFRSHFFWFLLLVAWISLRVIIDLGDLDHLKALTIATTGGILLFYLVGAALGVGYQNIACKSKKSWLSQAILCLFTFLTFELIFSLVGRLRADLFLIADLQGAYQRPGNFLSISFITVSYFFFLHALKIRRTLLSRLEVSLWFLIYTASTLITVVSAQLFGSNSATAVILGVYLITLMMSLTVVGDGVWLSYLKHGLSLPWSKRLLQRLLIMGSIACFILMLSIGLVVVATDFNITNIRFFGFGSGVNASINSRMEILIRTGVAQVSYAPLFGNMNVHYLTGNSEADLHNFFPYVLANLGIVGLSLSLILFRSVFTQLLQESKRKLGDQQSSFQSNMLALFSFFILLYLLLFANLSVGVSWPVLWFTLGFASSPFGFKVRLSR